MAMVVPEQIKARAEELRTKIRSRIEELRGGASSPGHSPLIGKLELAKGPLVTELREKGLLATARARFERFRGGTSSGSSPSPAGSSPPLIEEKEIKVRGARLLQ